MPYQNVIKKGWPANLIAAVWPEWFLYDINTSALLDAVKSLPAGHARHIEMRYGKMMTYESIAAARNISETRVAQVDGSAIRRLRRAADKAGIAALKPAKQREGLISTDNLDGYVRRYGGTTNDPDIKFKDVIDIHVTGIRCPRCGKLFDRNGHPYTGLFVTGPREKTVKIICMACAYEISPFVIEPGNIKRKGVGRKRSIGPLEDKPAENSKAPVFGTEYIPEKDPILNQEYSSPRVTMPEELEKYLDGTKGDHKS